MAQLSYILISSAIFLISLPFLPCNAVEFSIATFQSFFAGDEGPLHYSGLCPPGSPKYANGSKYESNLSIAFSNLNTAASASKTFSNTTVGSAGHDIVHAAYYCFNNAKPNNCVECVQILTRILSVNCTTKEAIVYSNTCTVRYTNRLAFPEDDTTSYLYCDDLMAMVPDTVVLNQTVTTTITKIINQLNSSSSESYHYSVEPAQWFLNQKLYTVVQCAPHDVISLEECKDCLLRALNETQQCFNEGTAAGFDYRPYCWMKYDLQPFRSVMSPAPESSSQNLSHPPNNTSNKPGSQRSTSTLCMIAASIILLLLGIY